MGSQILAGSFQKQTTVLAASLKAGDVIDVNMVGGWCAAVEVTSDPTPYDCDKLHGPRVLVFGVSDGRLVRVLLATDLPVRLAQRAA